MKKLIVLVIAAVMVLSMIPAMAFSTSAVAFADCEYDLPEPSEGFWSVYRDVGDYDPDVIATLTYNPASGYEYNSEGFHTISPDFTN